jgi:hypothetical protein
MEIYQLPLASASGQVEKDSGFSQIQSKIIPFGFSPN